MFFAGGDKWLKPVERRLFVGDKQAADFCNKLRFISLEADFVTSSEFFSNFDETGELLLFQFIFIFTFDSHSSQVFVCFSYSTCVMSFRYLHCVFPLPIFDFFFFFSFL